MNLNRSALAVLFLALTATRTDAQTSGGIEGNVTDPGKLPMKAAAIQVVHRGTGVSRSILTDEHGRYFVPGLSAGTYRIEAGAAGFKTSVREAVELSAGRTLQLDFSLQLGEVREITVVESAPLLVATSATDWGGTIDREQLASLPLNGRDIFDLAAQEPGVSVSTHGEGAIFNGLGILISVNGNRPNQNSFRMDGIYLNDASASAPASSAGRLLGVEGIQELRLITNPFSAEYGKAAGGVLTAVTRSGSNEWHGSAYHYLRNSAMDAKNFFDSKTESIPAFRRNQFGGLLSGPIKTNRMFFLLNYEGIREGRSRSQRAVTLSTNGRQGILPTGPVAIASAVRPYLALYPTANGRDFGDGSAEFLSQAGTQTTENYGSARTDFVISSRLRTSVHLTMDRAATNNPDLFLLWKLQKDSQFQFLRSATEFVQSPHTLHSFRVGYSSVRNNEDGDVTGVPAELSFVRGRKIGQLSVTGLSELTDRTVGALPRFQALQDYLVNHDVSQIRSGHSLRFGGGYDLIRFRQQADFNANGRYIFTSIPNLLRGIARSGDLMSPESDTNRLWTQHQYYFYIQDEWRPTQKLNVAVGVRYEGYTSPSEASGKIATLPNPLTDTQMTIGGPLFRNPSKTNFAPRAAVSWSPFQSGRTVIRAGAGMFFDLLTSREVVIAGMRVTPFFNRVILNAPPFPNLLAAAQAAPTDKTLDGIGYAMTQPYVMQFRFAVQQQIGASTIVEAGYSGSKGVHLLGQFGDMNIAVPQTLADGRQFFPEGAPLRNPAFGRIGMRSTDFNSVYHAMVLQLRRRFSSRLGFQTSYTWAKNIDDSSSSTNTEFDNSDRHPFPLNNRLQRGLSDFDVRQTLTANLNWQLPGPATGWGKHLAAGWQLSGLGQVQSGFPFNPRIGFDRMRHRSGFGDLDQRPSLASANPVNVILGDPTRYFDPTAFTLPDAGFQGNLGRNTLQGPGLFSINASAQKSIWQTERHQLRLRLDAFNLTNHPNFDLPTGLVLFASTGSRVGSAGQITATSTGAREVQLSLRWAF